MTQIHTICPGCGGRTLIIGGDGSLICANLQCTNPTILHDMAQQVYEARAVPIPNVRAQALREINHERNSQDAAWRDRGVMDAQYQYTAPHILVLEENVAKLRHIWYGLKDEGSLRERFVKIAACALRALEEITITKG